MRHDQLIHPELIRQTILEKVQQHGLETTICPSAVARSLGGEDWRSRMNTDWFISFWIPDSDYVVSVSLSFWFKFGERPSNKMKGVPFSIKFP